MQIAELYQSQEQVKNRKDKVEDEEEGFYWFYILSFVFHVFSKSLVLRMDFSHFLNHRFSKIYISNQVAYSFHPMPDGGAEDNCG